MPEPTKVETLSGALLSSRLLPLNKNMQLDKKKLAYDKHSSLFWCIVSEEERKG
jgi:hypothetical protein